VEPRYCRQLSSALTPQEFFVESMGGGYMHFTGTKRAHSVYRFFSAMRSRVEWKLISSKQLEEAFGFLRESYGYAFLQLQILESPTVFHTNQLYAKGSLTIKLAQHTQRSHTPIP
jgi:hypothetical protein